MMRVPSTPLRGSHHGLSWWLVSAVLASAGVVSDGSRGSVLSRAGFDFDITSGAKVCGNLFHCFSKFDLGYAESATFRGPNDVTNIPSLVTGGSASSIDGTIRSIISVANLFLMNPKGLVFGPNAKLDIQGSFAVSTADYLELADGGKFNAQLGGDDSLTSAPVSAFGFFNSAPAAVTFNQSQLSVQPSRGLHIIAGGVALNVASLQAPSGFLTVVSAAPTGVLPFTLATRGSGNAAVNFGARGTVTLANQSMLNTDGDGGGRLVIRSGKRTVDNSTISSSNTGPDTRCALNGGKQSQRSADK